MAKHENPNRLNTPIMITKTDKKEFRRYARPTNHPTRKKGNESDSELFHRMLQFIKEHWPMTSNIPVETYVKPATS